MSQCVSCANQPSDNDSLGGAAHEGTVTPMVIGIIIGTVFVFVLVVCALFYCVKLENHKYMAKIGDVVGGGGGDRSSDDDPSSSFSSSSPSSAAPAPAPAAPAAPAAAASAVGRSQALGRREDREGEREREQEREEEDVLSVKSRPSSSITVVPSRIGTGTGADEGVEAGVTVGHGAGEGCGTGTGKRRLFGWGRKTGELFQFFFFLFVIDSSCLLPPSPLLPPLPHLFLWLSFTMTSVRGSSY